MKSKSIVLIALVAVIIAMVGVVAYRGFSQTAVQNFNDQASCEANVKSQWCGGGLYACTPCTQYTLGYNILVNGQVTNKQWGADCTYGPSNTANGHTFCQAASSITSHVGYWCDSGNLYYFNSAGKREELKQTCTNGCTSIYKGGNTKESCNAAPTAPAPVQTAVVGYVIQSSKCVYVTSGAKYATLSACNAALPTAPATGGYTIGGPDALVMTAGRSCSGNMLCYQKECYDTATCSFGCEASGTSARCKPSGTLVTTEKVCMPGTNYLCNKALKQSDGTYLCNIDDKVYCPTGCASGACKPATCTNDCDTNGYTDCSGTDGFRTCIRGTDGCLHWGNKQYCGGSQSCQQGSCAANAVTPTPAPITGGATTPTTCAASFTCASDYTVSYTLKNCQTGTSPCANKDKCVNGDCVGTVQPQPDPVPAKNLCSGVSCADYCDASYTLSSQGSCDSNTGQCKYASVITNSEICLPKPGANQTTTTPTGDVVVPPRTDDTAKGAFWTWFDKYGYYVGGGVIVVLIGIFLLIDSKERKRRRR